MAAPLSPRKPRRGAARGRQAGLTLIELMVALVLGLLIAAASVAALIVARQGFKSVDTTAQLRENARFAAALIQRIAVQAGFENAAYGQITTAKEPGLDGFDNAVVGDVSAWTNAPAGLAHASRTSGTCGATDTSCVNGSDILIARYWGVSRAGAADGTMINCAGMAEPEGADRAYSIFHVARSTAGEPVLACTYRLPSGAARPSSCPSPNEWCTVSLVSGVEGFQVLYGVDTLDAAGATGTDSVADRYLRAADLATTPTATPIENWRRVRTLRIGLVVRGATPDAVDRAATAAASMPVLGSGFTNADDLLTVAADGRLRQSLVFTVHLRNAQFAP